MFVSKYTRIISVVAFVGAGYVGCNCNPPANPPSGDTCINESKQETQWGFTDPTCGCVAGNVKCEYESRIMSCFTDTKGHPYSCTKLPSKFRATDNNKEPWEVLYLQQLDLGAAGEPIRQCIERVNQLSGNRVKAHTLPVCQKAEAASLAPAAAAPPDGGTSATDGGVPMPMPAPDPCGSGGCLLPANAWSTCDSSHPCE